jgi:Anti-sigma factor NepR
MMSKNGSSWSDGGNAPPATQKALSQQQPSETGEKDEAEDRLAAERKTQMKPQATAGPTKEEAPQEGMIERSLQAQLGRQLRTIFSDVAEEPVPDRFVKLLEELEAREKRR